MSLPCGLIVVLHGVVNLNWKNSCKLQNIPVWLEILDKYTLDFSGRKDNCNCFMIYYKNNMTKTIHYLSLKLTKTRGCSLCVWQGPFH